MVRLLLKILFFALFASCVSEQKTEESVQVKNSGVFTPISFSVNGKNIGSVFDLGEYVTGSDARRIEVKVKNNTRFPMTDMGFVYPEKTTKSFGFYNEEGEGEYPGDGGSCGEILEPGKECLIILSFYVTKSGHYEELGLFEFKNLVEGENRSVRFKALAGQPASLVYDNGETNNFWFGNKVGIAQKPVLEREDRIEYTRELLVQNKGELSAREIDFGLNVRCVSADADFSGNLAQYSEIGYDPVDYCNVWQLEHNCPKTLAAGQSCKATVRFTPPNQNPEWGFDAVLNEITYQAEVRADYESTPDGETSALTGRFDTNSTSIEAKFASSTKEIDFGEEVTVGNFRKDLFKVKNEGYREGSLQALTFVKAAGVFEGEQEVVCFKDLSGDELLTCYDSDLENQLSLAQFPFVIKDRDSCMVAPGEEDIQIPVDGGCIFDLRFQPSISYQERKEFSYQLGVRYDSRRKGQETIKDADLFEIKSKSLHAGVIKIAKVSFDGNAVPLLGPSADGESPVFGQKVDFGRLALLSPGYETWRTISIVFQNVGGETVDLYKAFSGIDGGESGLVELLKGAGKNLGPHAVKYFEDAMISAENCGALGEIQSDPDLSSGIPPSQCVVTMSFAPVSMSTSLEQNQSMFDLLAQTPQKIFTFAYHDGANFSDANIFSETPDLAASSMDNWKSESLGITAELIQKGFLADYSGVSGNMGGITRGEIAYKNFIFRNIGTGPISWIPYTGDLLEHESSILYDRAFVRVDVANPGGYGADYDCNDVFDFGYRGDDDDGDGTPATAADASSVQARISSLSKLQKLETCVLRVRLADTNAMLEREGGENGPRLDNPIRSAGHDNSLLAWSLRENNRELALSLDFYDGDASGQPSSSDDLAKTFGEKYVTGESHLKIPLTVRGHIRDMARLVPAFPNPFTSAVIYSPSYTQPQYNYMNGAQTTVNQLVFGDAYFAAKNFYYLGTGEGSCVEYTSCLSPSFAQSSIANNLIVTGEGQPSYDYLVHVGTFPKDTEIRFGFHVVNRGGSQADPASETIVNQSSPAGNFFGFHTSHEDALTQLGRFSDNIGDKLGNNPSRPVKLVFQASQAGEYYADYLLEYATDSPLQPTQTLKVRLLARVLDPIADLEIKLEDYETEGGESLSGNPVVQDAGLNHHGSAEEVLFEAVRLDERSGSGPYVKKRFTFKNTSTVTMSSLELKFRDGPMGQQSNSVSMSAVADKAVKVTATDCPFGSPADFAPAEECFVDVWYQPDLKDSERTVSLTASFDVDPDPALFQYMQRNMSLRFSPKDPSVLLLAGAREENIRYRERGGDGTIISGQKAFILNFGTKTYNQESPQYVYLREVENDTTDSRASLLRQWELHRGLSNTGYGPGDINDYDGEGFTTILQEGPMEVKANSICLFGGVIESSLDNDEMGFNLDTSEACLLKFYFRPSFNMIGRQFSFTSVEDVSEVYSSLAYYNNKRSSVDDMMVTLTGRMHPPGSILQDPSNPYTDVDAVAGASVSFSWSAMTPQTTELGPIIGYRVYYTRFPDELGDVFKMVKSSANYVDVYSGFDTLIDNSNITNLTSYYLKVVAIRSNPDYNAGLFPGLAAGRFLSFPNIDVLEVTVPSPEFLYSHQLRAFVPFERLNGIFTYDEAQSACSGLGPVYISNSGESKAKYFSLITQGAWDFIESDFNFTSSYSDVTTMAHWIDTGLIYDIETIFGGQTSPVYDPLATYQNFEGLGQAYFRPTDEMALQYGTYMVAKTEGGLFGSAEFSGYESFMGPAYPEGVARCFIPLD